MGEGKRTAVRATATFSYISGLASFALAMTLLAPWALDLRTRRGLVLGTATIAAGLAALVASGSRGPLFAALVGLPVATWPLWRHNLGRAARGLAIAGGLAALLSLLFADTFGAFAERTRNSKDLGDRATWPIRHILKAAPQAGLMGSGPGTAHQSRSALLALTGESGRLPPQWDSEIANVFFELGAVGGALWYALRLALLAMLVLWVRDQRTPMRAEDRLGAFGLVALSLYTLATGMVFNHTLYYLWAFCVATLRQVSADEPA
jgi:MFS family permease